MPLSELPDLLPEWRELYARTPALSPFADPDVQVVWGQRYVAPGEELVLTARRSTTGELVGVVTLFMTVGGRAGRLVRHLRPFGSHREAFVHEMPEFTIDPAAARSVLAAVVQWFGEHDDWDFVELSLRDDQPWMESRWFVEAGLTTAVRLHKKAYPSVVMTLPPDGGLPPLKRNLKESLRRSRNRMKNIDGVWHTVRTAAGDEGWSEALGDLVRLHGERSRMGDDAVAHVDWFTGTSQQAYVEALGAVEEPSTRPVVHRLTLDGVTVAALLTFEYRDGTWISASGSLPDYWELGAVTALQWEAVQAAAARHATTVVFSVGIDTAKLRWSESVRVRNGFLFSHSRWRSRWMFRLYWLVFQYRSSLVDVALHTSTRQQRRILARHTTAEPTTPAPHRSADREA